MEISEKKRALKSKFTEIAKDKAAHDIEIYLLGYQRGLMEASGAEAADANSEKEPA